MNPGVKVYRNYYALRDRKGLTCRYGECYPVYHNFMVPGDVFKVHSDMLIRYQPMLTPSITGATARVRFAFIPLRLVVEDIELIITGSKDGILSQDTLPVCDSVFKYLDITSSGAKTKVEKNSILNIYFGVKKNLDLSGNLDLLDSMESAPALYWVLAFLRFWWDYYRDENFFTDYDDFDAFAAEAVKHLHEASFQLPVYLKKDRITSALPWQLKAVAAPTVEIIQNGAFITQNMPDLAKALPAGGTANINTYANVDSDGAAPLTAQGMNSTQLENFNNNWRDYWADQEVILTRAGFNAAQVREMMQQTRVYERLARCGSRYTEYLRANFSIAPADGTLQRAQYIGGYKARVVTTEVVQMAGAVDGSGSQTPVGTLRGHGISRGSATIPNYIAKEFGVMIGVVDIMPDLVWTDGIQKQFTYRKRFDFFNPSFQHLSEQEVRKGEVYFDVDLNDNNLPANDDTWGFQPYAEELRRGREMMVGDMADDLAYWNQAIQLTQRPGLNNTFLEATSHLASFNKPFAVSGTDARPIILDCGFLTEAYRPIVKDAVPGLVDHN